MFKPFSNIVGFSVKDEIKGLKTKAWIISSLTRLPFNKNDQKMADGQNEKIKSNLKLFSLKNLRRTVTISLMGGQQ